MVAMYGHLGKFSDHILMLCHAFWDFSSCLLSSIHFNLFVYRHVTIPLSHGSLQNKTQQIPSEQAHQQVLVVFVTDENNGQKPNWAAVAEGWSSCFAVVGMTTKPHRTCAELCIWPHGKQQIQIQKDNITINQHMKNVGNIKKSKFPTVKLF